VGTILIGYDTETGAVGEALSRMPESPNYASHRLALEPDTCAKALALLTRIHDEEGVPATIFICGRTLLHSLDAVREANATGIFDVQQHTFSHVAFRDIEYAPRPGILARIPASPIEALREEVAWTSTLVERYLGHPVVGIRTPFGYYRGLRERPDLLEVLRVAGIRYVTSWGRNEQNGNPTPWVQPFAYAEEGYPDILEIPFQHWLDVVWFDTYGFDSGAGLLQSLRGAVDEVADGDLVYGACFHDWVALASDEEHVGWLRGFLQYARERGVEVTTYTEYWRRSTGAS
jgi:peptidoglycan/xylan/chitin deacetylase (PgdA/CDA1 family)